MTASGVHFEASSYSKVTLVNERHCQRSVGGYRFNDFAGARTAMMAGGQLQELSFTIRHPECMVCDLSNLDMPFALWSKTTIEQAFHAIDAALLANRKPDYLHRITGNDLKPEIAVSGPSREALDAWRHEFLLEVLAVNGGQASAPGDAPRGLQKSRPLIEVGDLAQRWLREFTLYYSQFVHPAYWDEHPALNLQKLYCDHPVWRDLAALPGRKLFVLSSGLSLGLSYIASSGDGDIFFTELHGQNDANQLGRLSSFAGVYPEPPNERDWVVIDKAYSGGTIDAAAAILRAKLGRPINITKVALFPKSLQALKRADYAVYAGRLFRCSEVVPGLSADHWHLELLRAT